MGATAPPRPPRESDPIDRAELEALVEALIQEARQRARRRRRRNAAVVTLVALVGAALFALLGRSAQSQTASPALAARSSLPTGATSSKIAFVSEPPHGGYCGVVHVMNADGSGQHRLFTGGDPRCDQERGQAWSPDGRRVAILHNSTIYVMNADGSEQHSLRNGGASAWSPDGRQIAFVKSRPLRTAEVYIVNADGGGERMLTRTAGNGTPSWSPDGRRIAFVSQRGSNLEISVINADGSGQRRLTRNARRDGNPVWSPDGRRIAFESNWQVYVMNPDGSGLRRLTDNGARNFAPSWSPDGRRIAFERRVGRQQYGRCNACGRAAKFEVWVMNADGSGARMLAQDGAEPVWSPDGRKIAFKKILGRDLRGYPVESDIYVMNADGSGQRNLTRAAGRRESQPVWSPAQKP